ncbi:MAG: major capsid protein [Desulfarculus sp.]|nr:major capsid protein [Desulfarculus sp.]
MDPTQYPHLHWKALSASINSMPGVPTLMQQLLFKSRNSQASTTIQVDQITGGKYVLPFVAPSGSGVVVSKSGRQTKDVTAPMIRVKQPFTARELLLERGVGQAQFVGGAGDVQSAREARIAREQKYLKDRAERTIEFMCAQAITTGKISATAGQEGNTVSFEVDFGVPDAHKPAALAGNYVWGGANADVPGNIQTWADLILSDGVGAADLMILGTDAASKFLADANVLKELDNRNLGVGSFQISVGNAYIGRYKGLDVYRYPFEYQTKAGVKTKLVGSKLCVLACSQARYSVEFGMIEDLDAEAALVAEYFSKSWVTKDPSQLWLLAETHPLPVIWEPANIVIAQVLA